MKYQKTLHKILLQNFNNKIICLINVQINYKIGFFYNNKNRKYNIIFI